MNSVLLDTSFLISLSDPTRPHHAAAVLYYRECARRQVAMFLSTVVVSEFQVKQAINDLPLRNFVMLPFNADHAMRCGLMIRQMPRDAGDDRVRVKDDFKLLAQCDCEAITHLISEDASTLAKYLDRARETGLASTRMFCCAMALMRPGLRTARHGCCLSFDAVQKRTPKQRGCRSS